MERLTLSSRYYGKRKSRTICRRGKKGSASRTGPGGFNGYRWGKHTSITSADESNRREIRRETGTKKGEEKKVIFSEARGSGLRPCLGVNRGLESITRTADVRKTWGKNA